MISAQARGVKTDLATLVAVPSCGQQIYDLGLQMLLTDYLRFQLPINFY